MRKYTVQIEIEALSIGDALKNVEYVIKKLQKGHKDARLKFCIEKSKEKTAAFM